MKGKKKDLEDWKMTRRNRSNIKRDEYIKRRERKRNRTKERKGEKKNGKKGEKRK